MSVASGVPVFYQMRGPEDEEVGDIIIVIADKIISHLRELNYLPPEDDEIAETTAPFNHALIKSTRCASAYGFTLHANRYIGEKERHKLEELLSYAARQVLFPRGREFFTTCSLQSISLN